MTASEPLSIVCWKWKSPAGYRSTFTGEHVNVLRSMVQRHYPAPHRFICVTDDWGGIYDDIEIIPLWDDFKDIPSPHGNGNPSCYRRLRAFSEEASSLFGPRFVSLDLDVVILGDMRPVWDRPEDFVIWGDTAIGTPYNGGMFLLRSGTRRAVWDQFDPVKSPPIGRQRGYIGSDQAWIAVALGPNEKIWTIKDGVVSYRNQIQIKGQPLPSDARIVMFHGKHDPWHADIQAAYPWVRENWR